MRDIKLGIIYGDVSTNHQLIIERAQELFDSVLAAPVDGLKFVHGEEDSKVIYKGTDLTDFDAVYIRTGDKDKMFSEHVAEMLNESGVVTQAENDTYAYESNKFYSMKVLADNGVKVPDSVYTISPSTAVEAAEKLGYPVIMKTIGGGGGQGVMRATSENELKPVMDTMQVLEQDICLQEYMEHSGTDNRVLVIGDRVYSYQRSSQGDDWRSNLGAGGERQEGELTEKMEKEATRAVKSVGFDIGGCDIIDIEDGIYMLEVNGAFGLSEEINQILGEDIVLEIVERLHDRAIKQENTSRKETLQK